MIHTTRFKDIEGDGMVLVFEANGVPRFYVKNGVQGICYKPVGLTTDGTMPVFERDDRHDRVFKDIDFVVVFDV